MAIVNKLVRESKSVTKQTDVNCTYDIFKIDGENWLQLDTFGSKKRKMLGKKSQSIRFSSYLSFNSILRTVSYLLGN